jgi:hypothetical protein
VKRRDPISDYVLDAIVLRDIRILFRTPESALAIFGEGPAAFPRGWREDALSTTIPLVERLSLLDRELRRQLHLLAEQVAEFEDEESLGRLEAEAIAVLIALRELHRHAPELAVSRQELWDSQSRTEDDLRWVLSKVTLPNATTRWIEELLDHNELGLAWESLSESLIDPTPDVQARLEQARERMGIALRSEAD